ncbi:ABC transporter permease [Salinilacihabitans rarus]|uniref:ABC transporter permease n=1 Tax=Salinilacihabitans rarus TaxID=2961596 RepID=UPI0020C91A29|nr:ABC transporter permease [Salinilacihabitans rarus]
MSAAEYAESTAEGAREETGDGAAPGSARLVGTVLDREVRTVVRTPAFSLLAAALAAVLLGIAWTGGGIGAGYVPTAVDLLTPLELLVPAVAFAFGYRAILAADRRGELDVLETYPVSPREFVLGVYLGRAVGLVVAVGLPLAVVAAAVALSGTDVTPIYATHEGVDSPLLFARFAALTVGFALASLAVAVAVSALATATRGAIALAAIALVGLLVGLDLALVYGFGAGVVGESSLVYSLALSPLSAYRGLVLETAVVVASGTGPRAASPAASALGLLLWTAASLAVATLAVRRS